MRGRKPACWNGLPQIGTQIMTKAKPFVIAVFFLILGLSLHATAGLGAGR